MDAPRTGSSAARTPAPSPAGTPNPASRAEAPVGADVGAEQESRWVRTAAALGFLLAALCVLCGVLMLSLKLFGYHPWPLLSQIPLVLLPVAFVLLMLALFLAVLRRRSR